MAALERCCGVFYYFVGKYEASKREVYANIKVYKISVHRACFVLQSKYKDFNVLIVLSSYMEFCDFLFKNLKISLKKKCR